MGKVIRTLGLLASVMALSSLIYGAIQEPLGPYMQGIIGGVMDAYRAMRDNFFEWIGWVFSQPINWLAQWLRWLPPAPWFSISPSFADLLTFISITLASAVSSRGPTKAAAQNPYTFGPWARFSFTVWFFLLYLVGAAVYFLLAYAETRMGL